MNFFQPTYNSKDFSNYTLHGHQGKKKFHGTYDEQLYYKMVSNTSALGIAEDVWPYYQIEEDFYEFNKLGYRTYEFEDLEENNFDLVLGCSFVEGLGLRKNELWVSHFEKMTGTKLVNLGKGGASCTHTKMILLSWIMNVMPKPRNVIVVWTEPARETFVREGNVYQNLNPGYTVIDTILSDVDYSINSVYKSILPHSSVWSNRFIDTFSTTNVIMKLWGVPVHNFFLEMFWSDDNIDMIRQMTGISGTRLIYNNVEGGWKKYGPPGQSLFYPACDGIHYGPQHQKPLAEQIYKVIYEKD